MANIMDSRRRCMYSHQCLQVRSSRGFVYRCVHNLMELCNGVVGFLARPLEAITQSKTGVRPLLFLDKATFWIGPYVSAQPMPAQPVYSYGQAQPTYMYPPSSQPMPYQGMTPMYQNSGPTLIQGQDFASVGCSGLLPFSGRSCRT